MAENKMKQDVSKAIRASDSDKSFARLFHGSAHGSLTVLEPSLSEHGEAFVYFTVNPVIALIYTVKPVPKPFSFYPYGFDENGRVVYSEYWKNAFYDLYKGKTGFLYECAEVSGLFNPTAINGVFVSRKAHRLPNVLKFLMFMTSLRNTKAKVCLQLNRLTAFQSRNWILSKTTCAVPPSAMI